MPSTFTPTISTSGGRQFSLKVSHSNGSPILFLPDRDTNPDLPEGWTDVQIDGEILRANFVKVALNVVESASGEGNVLPQILRKWFSEDAGLPGTRHQVILKLDRDGWSLAPPPESYSKGFGKRFRILNHYSVGRAANSTPWGHGW